MSVNNRIIKENLNKQKKNFNKMALAFNTENKNENTINNNNIYLPSIKLKNKSNNCNINKNHFFIQKLVFNPISSENQKKLFKRNILSPICHSSLHKNYSSMELNSLSKQKLQPLNLNRASSGTKIENHSFIKNRSENLKQISNNFNSNHNQNNYNNDNKNINSKHLHLNFINFLTKYKFRGNNTPLLRHKYKFISNKKYLEEFKKSILDLYNKVETTKKKYLNNANFVHYFLFNTDRTIHPFHHSSSADNKNSAKIISYNNNINNINPKYEYINYFGKENKIITRLTSDTNKMSQDNKSDNEINNDVKLHKKLKVPKLIALKDSEDYRNKNYIKILQKKKKNEKIIEEIKIKAKKSMDSTIEISKKGYEIIKNNKMKNFNGLIKNTVKEHESFVKKLNKQIEIDKEQYEKDFDLVHRKLSDI